MLRTLLAEHGEGRVPDERGAGARPGAAAAPQSDRGRAHAVGRADQGPPLRRPRLQAADADRPPHRRLRVVPAARRDRSRAGRRRARPRRRRARTSAPGSRERGYRVVDGRGRATSRRDATARARAISTPDRRARSRCAERTALVTSAPVELRGARRRAGTSRSLADREEAHAALGHRHRALGVWRNRRRGSCRPSARPRRCGRARPRPPSTADRACVPSDSAIDRSDGPRNSAVDARRRGDRVEIGERGAVSIIASVTMLSLASRR